MTQGPRELSRQKERCHLVRQELARRPVTVHCGADPRATQLLDKFRKHLGQWDEKGKSTCQGFCRMFQGMNVLDKQVREAVDKVCEIICLGAMDKSGDREERSIRFVQDLPAPFMTPSTIVVCCQGLMNSVKFFREKKAEIQMSVGAVVPDLRHYEVRAAHELAKIM